MDKNSKKLESFMISFAEEFAVSKLEDSDIGTWWRKVVKEMTEQDLTSILKTLNDRSELQGKNVVLEKIKSIAQEALFSR